MEINKILAEEFNITEEQVANTVALIDEGNTIPFISRYRKEVTGSLDDSVLRDIFDRLTYLRKLDERREEVRGLIAAQEKLTPEIEFALGLAKTLVEIEDIYRPFKPKRTTRASIARAKGLEPLANYIMEQKDSYDPEIAVYAEEFISGGDMEITINGKITSKYPDVYPEAEISKFIKLVQYKGVIDCDNTVLRQFNISRLIIQGYSFPHTDCRNVQPYTLNCVAVEPSEAVELKIAEAEVVDTAIKHTNKWIKWVKFGAEVIDPTSLIKFAWL